jgi:hypothetical protein
MLLNGFGDFIVAKVGVYDVVIYAAWREDQAAWLVVTWPRLVFTLFWRQSIFVLINAENCALLQRLVQVIWKKSD